MISHLPAASAKPQAKLEVGAPDDAYEQEADRIADEVMGMASAGPTAPPRRDRELTIQRKCSKCADEEETIQRDAAPGAGVAPSYQMAIEAARGGGQPMTSAERAFFEPRFGYDFSRVRIHDDSRAKVAAHAVGARAFTLGSHIYLGAGVKREGTSARRLLAHELAHVVQNGGVGRGLIQRDPNDDLVAAREAELTRRRTELQTQSRTAPTSEEREDASIRAALLEAARTFGELDGKSRAFAQPLYRFGRGTPASRMEWQGVLRQLFQAGFVERACFPYNPNLPQPLPPNVQCHPRWESLVRYQGQLVQVYPAWRSLVYDHPEVQAIRGLGNEFVDAYWIGRYRGQREMSTWNFWDWLDMAEPVFAGLGAVPLRQTLGLTGRSLQGLAQSLMRTRPISFLVSNLRRLEPIANFARSSRAALRGTLETARNWITTQLRLTADIAFNLSQPAIGRLVSLGRLALERIAQLSAAAKRLLLGCLSPCAVNIERIRQWLSSPQYTGSGSVLSTVDDVVAALPAGINTNAIRAYLGRHPGVMTFLREARVTGEDIHILQAFLSAADTSGSSARRTFSRFVSQLVPAKVGSNVAEFNRIMAAAAAAEPRGAVSALRGPMFEAWGWQYLADFRGVTFARLAFETGPGLRLSRGRSFDGFVAGLQRVYDFKHAFSLVDAAQLSDYLKILTYELRQATPRFRQIIYVFPSREAAQANRQLLRYASSGIIVKYVSPTGRLLRL